MFCCIGRIAARIALVSISRRLRRGGWAGVALRVCSVCATLLDTGIGLGGPRVWLLEAEAEAEAEARAGDARPGCKWRVYSWMHEVSIFFCRGMMLCHAG